MTTGAASIGSRQYQHAVIPTVSGSPHVEQVGRTASPHRRHACDPSGIGARQAGQTGITLPDRSSGLALWAEVV